MPGTSSTSPPSASTAPEAMSRSREQSDRPGFLASLGPAWEKEALAAATQTRVVLLRSGIVLDREGGALPQMALPFRFFVGGPIGSGRQYLSWVHRDDWTSMVGWALTKTAVTGRSTSPRRTR